MTRRMKDSGVEWIGEIPEHWEVVKLNNIFSVIGSGTTPQSSNEEYYNGDINWIQSGDINGSIIRGTSKKITSLATKDISTLKMYKPNFIVIAMYGASIANISISHIEACVNQACCVLSEPIANIQYVFNFLKASKENILTLSAGGTQPNISQFIIKQLRITNPPLIEQEEIANYLDKKTQEIDNIILKTKKVIEEYKNYKQSLITETVTKGLDKNAPMRDSGIEWLGEIPEHWEAIRLKYLVSCNQRTLSSSTSDFYEFRYVDIGSVDFHKGITQYENLKYKDSPSRARRIVKNGDIIVSTVRTYLRAIATILDDQDVIVSTGFAVLTPKSITEKYLEYIIKTEYFITEVIRKSVGVSYPSINSKDLLEIKLPLPLKEEQELIASYLDQKCSQIDSIISSKEKLLTEMESYKKSLIYETVTGKREVE